MKYPFVLFLLCALCIWSSCTKRDDVQCICHGNGQYNSYDLGIQSKPSAHANAAKCDTLGFHDNLDSCNLMIMGN